MPVPLWPRQHQDRKPISTELAFIDALRTIASHPASRDLADDAAVLELGDEVLVLTHDTMIEGTHWLAGQDMADVAWKLVATNLSDLAAKGAQPLGVMLSFTLGGDEARFLDGLREVLEVYSAPLLGGDTVSGCSGSRTLGLTALGRASHTPVPDRRGARPGDALYVTGTLGAAMLGFEALRDGKTGVDTSAYRRPIPRLGEGIALAPHVTAMMDISDGLLLDAWRLARASGVTLNIDSAAVPVADETRRDACMRWGDDYELLFTAPAGLRLPVAAQRIGMAEQHLPGTLTLDGRLLEGPEGLGWSH